MGSNTSHQVSDMDLKYQQKVRNRKLSELKRSCAVLNCPNQKVPVANYKIKFVPFPKDECLREEWLNRIGRKYITDVSNLRICSAHFNEWNPRNPTIGNRKRKLEEDSSFKNSTNDPKICRLCSMEADNLIPIFKRSDESLNILKNIENLFEFKLKELNNFPSGICPNCIEKVESMNAFITSVTKYQEDLLIKYGEKYEKCLNTVEYITVEEKKTKTDPEISLKDDNFYPETNEISKNEAIIVEEDLDFAHFEEFIIEEEVYDEEILIEPEKPKIIVEMPPGNELNKELTPTKNQNLFHTSKNNFPCKKCQVTFLNKEDFLEHRSKHYKCDVCGHFFEFEFLYQRHMRTHLPYEEVMNSCKLCGIKVKSMNELQRHLLKSHPEEMKYSCDVCGKLFNSESNARIHRRRVHEREKEQCTICGNYVKLLRKHTCLQSGTCICPICNKELKNKTSLQNHIYKMHKERSHPVDFSLITTK